MKKFIMCFVGAMLVLSLAACTPTPVKQSESATEPLVEASTGGASDKVPDPNVEPMEIISVYSSNEDATGLNQAMDAVDELTAQSLVDKLIEYGVLERSRVPMPSFVSKLRTSVPSSKTPYSISLSTSD